MVIESRTIVGAAGAFALVGAALWGSAMMLEPPTKANTGSVEVRQIEERSWAVEVKDLGAVDTTEATRTAAAR
ncbi:MAG: hypothetical protein EHM84_02560 [Lysobacterales bacterium]|jgi:hypothetical protein|nr:MAG: hypothetical protein EHM84_02560 [Xanthomonadales bacterium]